MQMDENISNSLYQVFIAEKRFEGCNDLYHHLLSILAYPSAAVVPSRLSAGSDYPGMG